MGDDDGESPSRGSNPVPMPAQEVPNNAVPQDRNAGRADTPGELVPEAAADAQHDLPPVLTVEELASLLRVNRNTAYQALARGEIPGARRIGRTVRVFRDAVLEWLRGQGRVSRRAKCP